jgi:PAS domain S-box-containing protein
MRSDRLRDVDLARAEAGGLRDLRMVMEDLLARGLPGAADDFPWPVLLHDGSRILHANPACLRWLACGGDGAVVGQRLDVLCSAEDQPSLLAALGAGSEGPAREPPSVPHIQRFRSHVGATLIGRVLARRQRIGEQDATYVLVEPGSTNDRSFELLRLLGEAVDHLSDIIFITEAHAIDRVGRRIVFVNRAFTDSSGFSASEVLGKTPNITIGNGTDRGTLSRLEGALRDTRPVREDLLKYAKDGTPYWVELQIIPVFDEAGQHSHWLSIQRDITERKRLEGRLLESARLAAAGTLSASLSSELSGPLASVNSSLEWLSERLPALLDEAGASDRPGAREVLEALADARASAERVVTATGYLGLLSESTPPARHSVRLDELLDDAIREAQRQLGSAVPFARSYEAHPVLLADPARLTHALRLVLLNAALAGGVEREVRVHLAQAIGPVRVIVADRGPGITAELGGKLSSPFGRHKPQGIGDALALFIASRLVAEMDGELLLSPGSDGGTRVELRLPLASA